MSAIRFYYAITNPPATPQPARPIPVPHRLQTGLVLGFAVLAAAAMLSLAVSSIAPAPPVNAAAAHYALNSLPIYGASEWG